MTTAMSPQTGQTNTSTGPSTGTVTTRTRSVVPPPRPATTGRPRRRRCATIVCVMRFWRSRVHCCTHFATGDTRTLSSGATRRGRAGACGVTLSPSGRGRMIIHGVLVSFSIQNPCKLRGLKLTVDVDSANYQSWYLLLGVEQLLGTQ